MKRIKLKNTCLLVFILLTACAAPSGESPEEIQQKLQSVVTELPGAVVSADGFTISYPNDSLFATGAVLPLPGGLVVLDPLIELLLQNQNIRVGGVVRSSGHNDEYDLLLAAKRKELLMRIFRNRGLNEGRLQLSAEAVAGAPFEINLQVIIPETADGEKR